MDTRFAPLFEPLKIGPVTAPNRFAVMPYANGHSYLMPNGAMGVRAMRAEGGWGCGMGRRWAVGGGAC